jgi:hypothetical protein
MPGRLRRWTGGKEPQLTASCSQQVFAVGQVVAWDSPAPVAARDACLGTILGYSHPSGRYLVLPHGIATPRWIKGTALRGAMAS